LFEVRKYFSLEITVFCGVTQYSLKYKSLFLLEEGNVALYQTVWCHLL